MGLLNWLFPTRSALLRIEHKLGVIMVKQSEVAADVRAATEQLRKIGAETTELLAKVDELEEAASNQDNASDELTAAVAALKEQAQKVDDLVADPTSDEPTEPSEPI